MHRVDLVTTADQVLTSAGLESPALETDILDIKRMYDVNVFGPMEMITQFTPLLLHVQGTIVNTGSQCYSIPFISFNFKDQANLSTSLIGLLSIMPYPLTAAYNGSKAALVQYSETLRLELEPLKIKVVTVVTGQVSSNLPTLPHLSENSIYKSLEPALAARTKAHQGMSFFTYNLDVRLFLNPELKISTHHTETMSPETFAAALVKHVTRSSPSSWFWKGTNSTVTWIVSTFAPRGSFVS